MSLKIDKGVEIVGGGSVSTRPPHFFSSFLSLQNICFVPFLIANFPFAAVVCVTFLVAGWHNSKAGRKAVTLSPAHGRSHAPWLDIEGASPSHL